MPRKGYNKWPPESPEDTSVLMDGRLIHLEPKEESVDKYVQIILKGPENNTPHSAAPLESKITRYEAEELFWWIWSLRLTPATPQQPMKGPRFQPPTHYTFKFNTGKQHCDPGNTIQFPPLPWGMDICKVTVAETNAHPHPGDWSITYNTNTISGKYTMPTSWSNPFTGECLEVAERYWIELDIDILAISKERWVYDSKGLNCKPTGVIKSEPSQVIITLPPTPEKPQVPVATQSEVCETSTPFEETASTFDPDLETGKCEKKWGGDLQQVGNRCFNCIEGYTYNHSFGRCYECTTGYSLRVYNGRWTCTRSCYNKQ